MNRDLYREEALARRGGAEPLDRLLRVTAPHMWMILAVLGLALTGLGGWLLLGRVERSVAADCVLVQPGPRRPVLAVAPGAVVEVLVAVGDPVEVGQPIARVSTAALAREVQRATVRVELLQQRSDAAAAGLLEQARAELFDLQVERTLGEYIASPFAGEVSSVSMTAGQVVEIGTEVARVRGGAAHELAAVALVAGSDAGLVAPRQPARVVPALSNGRDSATVEAEVDHVAGRADQLPDWLAPLGLAIDPGTHPVRLALKSQPAPALADGDRCRARIVVGTESPLRLLGADAGAGPAEPGGAEAHARSGHPPESSSPFTRVQ